MPASTPALRDIPSLRCQVCPHALARRLPSPGLARDGIGCSFAWMIGGARRDRTDDLKLAKLALSQLSYGPNPQIHHTSSCETAPDALVGLERFELSTSRLSSARSNQLSYRPGKRGVMSMRRKRNEDGGVPRLYYVDIADCSTIPVVPS